jgi:hypothetical protein
MKSRNSKFTEGDEKSGRILFVDPNSPEGILISAGGGSICIDSQHNDSEIVPPLETSLIP